MGALSALMVPIRVDALVLGAAQMVAHPFVDFAGMPWTGAEGDRNTDRPSLAAALLTPPFAERDTGTFANRTTVLGAGIHLHWALPDALHQGLANAPIASAAAGAAEEDALRQSALPEPLVRALAALGLQTPVNAGPAGEGRWRVLDRADPGGRSLLLARGSGHGQGGPRWRIIEPATVFPPAPNRWLVTRRADAAITAQWIVESDHLEPGAEAGDGAGYPWDGTPPFGRLGRTLPRSAWRPDLPPTGVRVRGLSAVGYGDPNFASFYPNCGGVFGLHDAAGSVAPGDGTAELIYDVIGWYADPADDPLGSEAHHATLDALIRRRGLDADMAGPDGATRLAEARAATLAAHYDWQVDADRGAALADARTVLFGRACIACHHYDARRVWGTSGDHARVRVAVGKTGTEALSARLAAEAPAADRWRLEEQLEAVQMADLLQEAPADPIAALDEARHQQGFTAVEAGTLWTLAAADGATTPDADPGPDLHARLVRLNQAQVAFDRARERLDAGRDLLFADWCRYLSAAYPGTEWFDPEPRPDLLRALIEAGPLAALDPQDGGSLAGSAARMATERDRLKAEIEEMLPANGSLALKAVAAPRYWQANDPVVLITGAAATVSPRHGQDGQLTCRIETLAADTVADALDALVALMPTCSVDAASGCNHCHGEPWNPLILEWEVSFEGAPGTGGTIPSRQIEADALVGNWPLAEGGVDFAGKKAADPQAPGIHRGATILTPHAKLQLRRRIEGMVRDRLEPPFRAAMPDAGAPFATDGDAFATLAAWHDAGNHQDAIAGSLIAVHRKLYADHDDRDYRVLSQALGGLSEALAMRHQTLQMPVDDPLGFASERAFAARVRAGVAEANRNAVLPRDAFHPIRAGTLEIRALRLVDSFGRFQDLDFEPAEVAVAGTLGGSSGRDGRIALPPRLMQPARLAFRWLAAETAAAEAMDAPGAGGPVIAWLVADRFDRAIAIHDPDGIPLGSLTEVGSGDATRVAWSAAPGQDLLTPFDLPDRFLRRIVQRWLDADGAPLFQRLEAHLDAIRPGTAGRVGDGLAAILTGRPLALVRARLALELMGPPLADQSPEALEARIGAWRARPDAPPPPPASRGFERLRVPVRLGAFGKLSDGLVACWPEAPDPKGQPGNAGPATYAEDGPTVTLSLTGDAATVTLLTDPLAEVHAVSGLLPVKAIDLPESQYADALGRIAAWLRVGPVLSPAGRVALPLPRIPGQDWQWVAAEAAALVAEGRVEDPAAGAFPWDARHELIEGWLRLVPDREGDTS
jgi:hypothetical protein